MYLNEERGQKKLISVKCFSGLHVALLRCTQSHHEEGRQTKEVIQSLRENVFHLVNIGHFNNNLEQAKSQHQHR